MAPVGIGAPLTAPQTTAGQIVNNVRALVPDPVYSADGIPLPDKDGGLLRAVDAYRLLDSAVRRMAQACGTIVTDWIAVAQATRQPWYALPTSFLTVSDMFSNQWPVEVTALTEGDVIWPSAGVAPGQSLFGYQRRRTDHLEVGLWPVPTKKDPTTVLADGGLGIAGTDPILVADTTNFLSYGYVQIDQEIIQYQQLVSGPTGLAVISRGVCGTTAANHLAGAVVTHLGLWVKGTRTPAQILSAASVVELPLDVTMHLETYLLACYRRAEQEDQEARALFKEFDTVCKELRADPTRRESMGLIPAYGSWRVGPIYGGGGGLIVP